ncbi:MAG: hypothetical protein AABW73_02180 [Nanoarchaeota archaeon]
MDDRKIELITQLVETMNDDLTKLKESYEKKDIEKLKKIKEEMIKIQKKIEEVTK